MFFGLLALLIPGIMIAYVLPLIPWVMWIAGVTGYLILVLEAVIAVPLMMVAHMTFDGEGLHGRAIQVYELLFNVLFRPGPDASRLFAGYFVFSSVSWLIRISSCRRAFSSRKGLVRHQSDREVVLLAIFVLLHIVVAIKAFGFDLAHPTSCAEDARLLAGQPRRYGRVQQGGRMDRHARNAAHDRSLCEKSAVRLGRTKCRE